MKKREITIRPARMLCILAMTLAMTSPAFAMQADAEPESSSVAVCYPTSITCSEDGCQMKKVYDLSPEDDPAGIPRSDFDQNGFHYTMTELLKQELPANESRQHTETISVQSKNKDMASVLALLPEKKEFVTDDGLSGILSLKLDTVDVTVAGYGSSTKEITATRTYPGLANQDTSCIPKTIAEGKEILELQSIHWQSDGTTGEGGKEQYTACADYSGTATSSYVKGYTVTADYTGTVSCIRLNKVRYVALFEGTPVESEESDTEHVNAYRYWLALTCAFAVAGAGVGFGFYQKRRKDR